MGRVVKKPEVRRGEIVATARHLFLRNGYENTSMQSVVDALGIAKGTIYHYFKFKEELLEAVINDLVAENQRRKQLLLQPLQGNALEKIRALAEMDAADNALLQELHQPGNIGLHARLLAVALVKEALLYSELIRQGCEEGFFHTHSPLECAEFFLAAVQFLTDVGIYPWAQEDLIRRARAFPSLIEALLKAPTGSFNFLLKKLKCC
jgi:AcrR family transcriptional regulator